MSVAMARILAKEAFIVDGMCVCLEMKVADLGTFYIRSRKSPAQNVRSQCGSHP